MSSFGIVLLVVWTFFVAAVMAVTWDQSILDKMLALWFFITVIIIFSTAFQGKSQGEG